MNIDFNAMTRRFLLNEGQKAAQPLELLQALRETLGSLRPATKTDLNRIEVAKTHLREVTRSFRKLQEQVSILEEQLKVLEEASTMSGGDVTGAPAAQGGAFSGVDMDDENKKEAARTRLNE